jgi:hypothetical protein
MSQHTGPAQLRGYERDLLPEAACGKSFCGVVQRYGTYYGASHLWRGVSRAFRSLFRRCAQKRTSEGCSNLIDHRFKSLRP